MAKIKTQKELLASVRESSLAHNYDLTLVDPREYAAPLSVLFQSEVWKDMFIRRNKLFRAAFNGDGNAFKQMEQIDKKVAGMILQTMFKYAHEASLASGGKIVTLKEYFDDFVRTDDQHELYNEFTIQMDSAFILSDIIETVLLDASATLKKLDPALVLKEFDSLKSSIKALGDFRTIHHRDEHPDLTSLFCDYAEETEDYLRMKTSLFANQYRDMKEALINKGEIKESKTKKHSDREYLTELMANYIRINDKGMANANSIEIEKKAKKIIGNFDDEELKEAMPTIIDLYKQAETIYVAKQQLSTIIKTLPENEVTKKIATYIL